MSAWGDLDELLDRGVTEVVAGRGDVVAQCRAFAARRSPRVIRHPDRRLYLSRYYLVGGPLSPRPFDRNGKPLPGVKWSSLPHGLYLHHFHASDLPRLHNHPWRIASSLMLAGGYREFRLDEEPREVLPGDRTRLSRATYHRVELLAPEAWTLFAVGEFVGSWGFKSAGVARQGPSSRLAW